MSEDLTLDEFVNKDGSTSNEPEKPELIQGVAWSTIGSIPDNWTSNNIESDIEILTGNNFSSDYFTDDDGIPLIRIRDLAEDDTTVYYNGDYDSKYLINQQDLLVGMDGEFEPHLWTGPQALLNQRVCKIESNERYNKIFFRYAIEKPLFYIQKSIAGTTVKHLSQSNINDLNLPTPPVEEQRKIATVLYTVDQAIQKTEEIIEQTLKIKNTTVDRLTMRGVDHDNFKQVDTSLRFFDLEIPEDWKKVSYEDISNNITYGFTSPMPEADSGPWMVTAKDIKNGRINYNTARKTTEEAFSERLTSKSRPEPGTVLITKDGTLGNVAIVDREGICINQSVASINPNQEKVKPEFLALTLNSPLTRKLIESFNPQTTIGHIKISELAEWELGLPPISEQEEIVSIVESIQRKYESEKEYKQSLQRLKTGLMQDLLPGTVRTTDTNIEVPNKIAQHG